MKPQRRLAPGLAAFLLVAALCACSEQAPPESTPTPEPTESATSSTPTPSATAAPAVFTQPGDCLAILPAERIAAFEASGLSLLGGPGGSKFGDSYFSEKTPEEQAGGITCVWGVDSSDFSSYVISVASLSPSNRPAVVGELIGQGLNESMEDRTQTYWILGDSQSEPAQYNAIRSDSWISVISTAGGQSAFDVAVTIAAEVAAVVYQPE